MPACWGGCSLIWRTTGNVELPGLRVDMDKRNKSIKLLARSGQVGGMELRLIDETVWLAEHGWCSELLVTPFEGVDLFLETVAKTRVAAAKLPFPLFMENWRWRRVLEVRARVRARRLSRRLRCHAAHVPFAWTDQGLTMLWLAARVSERIVVSVHNVFPPWQITEWHRRHLCGAFSRISGLYGVSRAATSSFMDIFGELLPAGALVLDIPNFVDSDRFSPSLVKRRAARKQLGFPDNALVVACVGRISEQKRPLMLLRVFARVAAAQPGLPLRLLYIGGGNLEVEMWRQAREAGVGQLISVTGFVDNPEFYLAAADAHVLMSAREGFGIATVEAMASGMPAVATDLPACREILDGKAGGVLVPVDDEASAASRLQRLLLNSEERCYRGRRAREEVLAEFGKSTWSERLNRFYRDALDPRERP